jgi:hypothetical protein
MNAASAFAGHRTRHETPKIASSISCDFHESIGEPIRLIEHHDVAGLHFERAPRFVGLAGRQRFVECRIRKSGGADVGLLRRLISGAGKLDRLQICSDRLRGQLGKHVGAVLLVDPDWKKRRRPERWREAGLTLFRGVQESFAEALVGQVKWFLSVFRLVGIEPDDRRDMIADPLKRARADPTAVGMGDQAKYSLPSGRSSVTLPLSYPPCCLNI